MASTVAKPNPMANATNVLGEWQENLNMTMICRDCKEIPPNLVEEFSSGDMVCGSCGLVLGDRIVDSRSEWRTFSNDENNDDPSRVGDAANPLLNGSQLSTSISFGDGGARSRELHRAQNKSSHDKATKGLLAAYKEIGTICDAMGIQKVASDTAKLLFKMVDDAKAFKGKPQEAIIAGCIFIACRQCKVGRTFKEVFAVTKVPKKEIGRVFKNLEIFFKEQKESMQNAIEEKGGIVNPDDSYETTMTTNPKDLCIRFCSNLGLPQICTLFSEQLAMKMLDRNILAGRSPLSAAAACIYFISHLMDFGKSAKEISAVAGVSDSTIRNSYKLLYEVKDTLIDETWIARGGKASRLPPN